MSYTFEVSVDSVESAIIAQDCGATRVELCADLGIGGITPSVGMITLARQRVHISLHIMIRPRRGDFLYSEAEFDVIRHDIAIAKSLQADGIVFGILQADGQIDMARSRELIALARPLEVTIHRAFDMTVDPLRALDDLIALGVDTLLTSGQEATTEQGLPLIAELVRQAEDRIRIMPGSGITPDNIRDIAEGSGAKAFHFSARKSVDSGMRFRNLNVAFTKNPESVYQRMYADADMIRAIISNVNSD